MLSMQQVFKNTTSQHTALNQTEQLNTARTNTEKMNMDLNSSLEFQQLVANEERK